MLINQSREELAKLFTGVGAEIGVEQGIFSEIICKASFNVKLFCIDAWMPYRAYHDHRGADKLKRFLWRTKKRLKPYNAHIIRKFSMDAVKDFEDCSLDFVYIDANHAYDFVMQDIIEWSKKVKPGGIIAGHDYIERPERGKNYMVKQAVDDYVRANKILDLKIYIDDQSPSWVFTKI